MGLLNIFALNYLALSSIIAFIYFFNRNSNVIYVSSLIPLKELKSEIVSSKKFVIDFLFILQIFLIILMSLFLARPYLSNSISIMHGYNKIVVVDSSASMQTIETKGTRFEQAKNKIIELIDDMGKYDKMMIISSYSSSEVIQKLDNYKDKLKKEVNDLKPTETTTDMESGTSLALSYMKKLDNSQLYILTDVSIEDCGFKPGDIDNSEVHYFRYGKNKQNVTISSLDMFQDLFKDKDEAYITLKNFSNELKDVHLSVHLNEHLLQETNFSLYGQEQKTITVRNISTPGILRVTIETDDDLKVDNVVYGIVKNRKKTINILQVTDSLQFINEFKKLAEAFKQVKIKALPTRLYVDNVYKGYDVIIFHKYIPDTAPRINSMFIYPIPTTSFETDILSNPFATNPAITNLLNQSLSNTNWKSFLMPKGFVSNAKILDWDNSHPTMKYLDYLDNINIQNALIFNMPENSRTLIFASGLVSNLIPNNTLPLRQNNIPLAFSTNLENTRSIVIGLDLEKFTFSETNNLPLLIMMINMIQWLSPLGENLDNTEPSSSPIKDQMKTGDLFFVNDLKNFQGLSFKNNDGVNTTVKSLNANKIARQKYSTETNSKIYTTIKNSGIYQAKNKDSENVFVANFFDEKESNLALQETNRDVKHNGTLYSDHASKITLQPTKKEEINEISRFILYLIPIFLLFEWAYSFIRR